MVEQHIKIDGPTANAIVTSYLTKAKLEQSQKAIQEGVDFLTEKCY